ncbi:TetR/AcrR family transcriptional regulator [Sporosarcina sp. JAI121]|uniref:TetR/AcrR family transcriptional regulator n=1 Tax=Sporosarcina sp. JAI121 TaxID=2723064 RepID=UPI0015CC2A8A|nr:TetR/AcrR family transcriptional regulator [Sporosarcina sp. JAI121]NYF24384.1 AcrR family transcriptional regulator [Sporosarcina sp. JAI121]
MDSKNRKFDILDAASRIVAEKGIFSLTLEAVAKEAGISKGGLLYHYQSKEELVEKMVEHLAVTYQSKIAAKAEADFEEKGKWSRAYLDVTFKQPYRKTDMHAGLLAAKAINPLLLNPIHEVYAEWQHEIENDGLDPIQATIIRLATDGIWLADLFGINPIDQGSKDLIYETLRRWTKE